jgi:hypothetical protein
VFASPSQGLKCCLVLATLEMEGTERLVRPARPTTLAGPVWLFEAGPYDLIVRQFDPAHERPATRLSAVTLKDLRPTTIVVDLPRGLSIEVSGWRTDALSRRQARVRPRNLGSALGFSEGQLHYLNEIREIVPVDAHANPRASIALPVWPSDEFDSVAHGLANTADQLRSSIACAGLPGGERRRCFRLTAGA